MYLHRYVCTSMYVCVYKSFVLYCAHVCTNIRTKQDLGVQSKYLFSHTKRCQTNTVNQSLVPKDTM